MVSKLVLKIYYLKWGWIGHICGSPYLVSQASPVTDKATQVNFFIVG